MNKQHDDVGDEELARSYERSGVDPDEWGEPEPVDKPSRLDVTLSVRFTAHEIATIRSRAARAELKPTTYIRQCVLAAERPPVDRALLDRSVAALTRDLDDLKGATA